MTTSRRALLAGLGAASILPARALAGDCEAADPTLPSVVGPFPPLEVHPTANGRPNPGERRPVAEHDLDLARVNGVEAPARGQIVGIRGRLLTRGCAPVVGARVVVWQADTDGHYDHENERSEVTADRLDPGFGYWGEATTDAEGGFLLRTVVPGGYPAGGDWIRPPHLHWTLRAEGRAPVDTQTFFEGDALAGIETIRKLNEADLILGLRDGFGGRLQGKALDAARRRVQAEQVVRFAMEEGTPVGSLTFWV